MKFGLHRWMAKELETLINLHQKVRSGFLSLIFFFVHYLNEGFYCCSKTPWPKATWGGNIYFILKLDGHSPSLKESGQELKK